MTSNLGADLISKSTEVGFGASEGNLDYDQMKEKIDKAVKKHFKPEFLNRLDDRVIFHPLDRTAILEVIDLEINKIQKRLNKKDIHIHLDDAAKDFLVEKGYLPEMGARPLRRTIEEYVEGPLAELILRHPNEGRRCLVTVEGDHLKLVDEEVFPIGVQKQEKASAAP